MDADELINVKFREKHGASKKSTAKNASAPTKKGGKAGRLLIPNYKSIYSTCFDGFLLEQGILSSAYARNGGGGKPPGNNLSAEKL